MDCQQEPLDLSNKSCKEASTEENMVSGSENLTLSITIKITLHSQNLIFIIDN